MRRKQTGREAWIRVVGLPLHLWARDIIHRIRDSCGGLLEIDLERNLRTEFRWVRLRVKREEKEGSNKINILDGLRSYEHFSRHEKSFLGLRFSDYRK